MLCSFLFLTVLMLCGLVIDLICMYINLTAKYQSFTSRLYIRAIIFIQMTNTGVWVNFVWLSMPYGLLCGGPVAHIGVLARWFDLSATTLNFVDAVFFILPCIAYFSTFIILYQSILPQESILKVEDENMKYLFVSMIALGVTFFVFFAFSFMISEILLARYIHNAVELVLFTTFLSIMLHAIYCLLKQKNRSEVTKKKQFRGFRMICLVASFPLLDGIVLSFILSRLYSTYSNYTILALSIACNFHIFVVNIILVYIVRTMWSKSSRITSYFGCLHRPQVISAAVSQTSDDLLDYSFRCRRTVAESLRDFPATAKSIPPERLFDIFTTIRPRAFSISSCREKHGSTIQLIVAKVEYKSRMSVPRRGLCSTFLSRLKSDDKVWVRIRPGTFKFPSADVPVVCVGPGTGIAPFRSYLNWRESQEGVTQSILFFGCRGPTKDFYFADEWKQMENMKMFTAFSRDGEHKKYVQDVMKEEKYILWQTLNGLGSIFVAGSSGDMPKGVAAALDDIALENNQDQFTSFLETKNRLQYETW